MLQDWRLKWIAIRLRVAIALKVNVNRLFNPRMRETLHFYEKLPPYCAGYRGAVKRTGADEVHAAACGSKC
jgi:hypothetical protein